MAEIPRVVKPEAVRVPPSTSNDGSASRAAWKMLRTEQKSVAMLAEVINQYTNPGDIFVDLRMYFRHSQGMSAVPSPACVFGL